MPDLISFKWSRPREPGSFMAHGSDWLFLPGEEGREYEPLKIEPLLWKQFHDLDLSPQGVMGFMDRYGRLSRDGYGELLSHWVAEVSAMREFVAHRVDGAGWEAEEWMQRFNESAIAQNGMTMEMQTPRHGGAPSLHLVPRSLLVAIWFQLAMQLTSGTGMKRCKWCGSPFIFGSGTGRRKSGHFCSDRCRKASWKQDKEG